jgi:pre-rRNA-processing protein TSR4
MASEEDLAHLVGVLEPIRFPQNTRFMFPSKVGGKPAWLIPSDIPGVRCDSCSSTMTFLLQIYAPDQGNDSAFHRTLMVFVCLACRCFLKCLRSQLGLINPFYPPEYLPIRDVPLDDQFDDICCDCCGMLRHDRGVCRILPESGIEIEEIDEIQIADVDQDNEDEVQNIDDTESQELLDSLLPKSDMTIDESEMDLFDEFTESQIERDHSFRLFRQFVEEVPNGHIVYYCVGGNPVWISDKNQFAGSPPECESCGAKRQFEFQIQPQLIYHLMTRLSGLSMDTAPFEWGVVCVYTCTSNCSGSGVSGYCEEFVFNQLEPREWLEVGSRQKIDFSRERADRKKAPPEMSQAQSSDEGEWI